MIKKKRIMLYLGLVIIAGILVALQSNKTPENVTQNKKIAIEEKKKEEKNKQDKNNIIQQTEKEKETLKELSQPQDKDAVKKVVKKEGEKKIKTVTSPEIPFEYSNNVSVLPFGSNIIIYDGKKLIKKNDQFKNVFEVRLDVPQYVIKTQGDKIFVLDKGQKVLYKLNENAEVEAQAKFSENAQNIYPLKNSDVLVQYSSAIGTDGIIAYDHRLNMVKTINYPNALVNTVEYEESGRNLIVSVQLTNQKDIINAIYEYNSKYEMESLNQYANLLTIMIKATNSNKLLLDPTVLHILDAKLKKNIAKIEAQHSFEKLILTNDRIYLQDGSKNIRIFDRSGKFIEEKVFRQSIIQIINSGSNNIYVARGTIYLKDFNIELAKNIEKTILLNNNKLVIFFKNGLQIVKL